MNSNHKSFSNPDFRVVGVSISATVPDIPFPEEVPSYSTFEDWLSKICEQEKPGKEVKTFRFGLFTAPECIVYLVGLNVSIKGYDSISTIAYEPRNMYFKWGQQESL